MANHLPVPVGKVHRVQAVPLALLSVVQVLALSLAVASAVSVPAAVDPAVPAVTSGYIARWYMGEYL
jgi:hypothetical protein